MSGGFKNLLIATWKPATNEGRGAASLQISHRTALKVETRKCSQLTFFNCLTAICA